MTHDEIMSARDLALLFAGGREAEKLAEAMTAWKIVHLRAEREACAKVADACNGPSKLTRDQTCKWIAATIRSRTEGDGK